MPRLSLSTHVYQSRIIQVTLNSVFVPMGIGRSRVALNVLGFVVVAAPFASVSALTDVLTTSVLTKLQLCATRIQPEASHSCCFG